MSDKQIDAIVMMAAGIRDDFTPESPRTYATTTPTTLTSWVADHLAALRACVDGLRD